MARTKRRNFDTATKKQITARATDARGVIRCEGCGLNLTHKAKEFDHIIAESVVPDWKKEQPLTASDGQLLGKDCCHRGPDGKTAKDVALAAKTKRVESKHIGIKPKKNTGLRATHKQNSATRPIEKWRAY
jgi:hypothetical protein